MATRAGRARRAIPVTAARRATTAHRARRAIPATAARGPKGDTGSKGHEGRYGVSCWDLNQDDQCNLDTEDVNHDGACDVLDCRGEHGAMGPKGDHGDVGPQGDSGAPGSQGPKGDGGGSGPQGGEGGRGEGGA